MIRVTIRELGTLLDIPYVHARGLLLALVAMDKAAKVDFKPGSGGRGRAQGVWQVPETIVVEVKRAEAVQHD